mmetsp:Transcript_7724/g.21988  ORF Transcript_7724/g.21988 Transcript_7724/m.21988 type:complete len:387 (+) Transcript_7724:84-1244(+)
MQARAVQVPGNFMPSCDPASRPGALPRFPRRCQVSLRAPRMCTAARASKGKELDAFLGFSDSNLDGSAIGIIGDLHLEPDQMHLFHQARAQIIGAVRELGGEEGSGRIVQLGDLGGYSCGPGGVECFRVAREFLAGFGMPVSLVTGNHDLEGAEFETDEENLQAWLMAFSQERHYWARDLGNILLIGLSTVRFRSNEFSVHEVFIDDEQLQWFKRTVADNADRPVVVFSHAPPAGCGLKVVQNVHVKNRCAWLNHSSNLGDFMEVVRQCPSIRLWFSGHFHLSHNYADSISVVGGAAFVQTGVIGEYHRDGLRQSRVVKLDREGYEVHTIDHSDASLRLDLKHAWSDLAPPKVEKLEHQQQCDPQVGECPGLAVLPLAVPHPTPQT